MLTQFSVFFLLHLAFWQVISVDGKMNKRKKELRKMNYILMYKHLHNYGGKWLNGMKNVKDTKM